MANSRTNIEIELEEDIEKIDEITLLAANILYDLENLISLGNFEPDKFQEEIEKKYTLDHRRKLLFERAVDVYRKAIAYMHENKATIGEFLGKTKLHLDKYEGISSSFDEKRPGVIVIKIKSKADAKQFRADIESESDKKLKKMGADTIVGAREGLDWFGLAIELKSLGVEEVLPILGVMVIRDDSTEYDRTFDHEYAHMQYNAIIKPFLHKYLSGLHGHSTKDAATGESAGLSIETRKKLWAALGDTMTDSQMKAMEPNTSSGDRRRVRKGPKIAIRTQDEKLYEQLDSTLLEEQALLNEMRAYGFSNGILLPNMEITSLKMEEPEIFGPTLGYIDPQMAQRFLQLHLLMLKVFLRSGDKFKKARCILGTAQTLSQAIKLLQGEKIDLFDSASNFATFVEVIIGSTSAEIDLLESYKIGKASIPRQEVLRTLLPSQEVFENAALKYQTSVEAEKIEIVRKLYQI